jgi:hypothetical protein
MEEDITLIDEIQNGANDQGNLEGSARHSIGKAKIQDSRPTRHEPSASTVPRRQDSMKLARKSLSSLPKEIHPGTIAKINGVPH